MSIHQPNHFSLMQGASQALQLTAKPVLGIMNDVIDDSQSIHFAGNTDVIIRGHNAKLDVCLEAATQNPRNVHVVTNRLFTDGSLCHNQPLAKAVRLDRDNYRPRHMTPMRDALYDSLIAVEQNVNNLQKQFPDYFVLALTSLLTDGADNTSVRSAGEVRKVVERLTLSGRHLIRAVAVKDGITNFYAVFEALGIERKNIDVWEQSQDEIAKGMRRDAHTTAYVMGDADTFTATMSGGFTRMSYDFDDPQVIDDS